MNTIPTIQVIRHARIKLAVALFGVMASYNGYAQDQEAPARWYDVEIIVLQNLDFNQNNTDTWPATGRLPDYNNAHDLNAPPDSGDDGGTDLPAENATEAEEPVLPYDTAGDTAGFQYPEPFSAPADDGLTLAGVLGSLRRSRNYRPLLHVAWTQPPLEREAAVPVRLYLPSEVDNESRPDNTDPRQSVFGDVYSSTAEGRDAASGLTVEPDFLPEPLFDPTQTDLRRPLDGTATLVVSRYLHLYLDLIFMPPELERRGAVAAEHSTNSDALRRELAQQLADGEISLAEAREQMREVGGTDFYGFRLDQSRRMRSREIHHFDHPAFSVISVVTPREFEIPEEDSTLQQANQGFQ